MPASASAFCWAGAAAIVTIVENVWIPLADGTRLAAKIWLPDSAQQQPVPALLEYIPYRKSDYTSARDAKRQAYLSGYGYANVRVDMRGSGDSDGILKGRPAAGAGGGAFV